MRELAVAHTESRTRHSRMTVSFERLGVDLHLRYAKMGYNEDPSGLHTMCSLFLPEGDPPALAWEPTVSDEALRLDPSLECIPAGGARVRGELRHGTLIWTFDRSIYWEADTDLIARFAVHLFNEDEDPGPLDDENTRFEVRLAYKAGGLKLVAVQMIVATSLEDQMVRST